MYKIPFGKHKVTGRLLDAGSVLKGLQCNCVCNECSGDLEAVNRTIPRTLNYFRHSSKSGCKGGLESLFHKVSKQILIENSELRMEDDCIFHYTHCNVETLRYGKRPDIYLSNTERSLIVEIYFWHRVENSTLETYLNNGERVLEIDISKQRNSIYDYETLKELLLKTAPRKLYEPGMKTTPKVADDVPWWLWLLFLLIVGFFIWKWWKKKKRRR